MFLLSTVGPRVAAVHLGVVALGLSLFGPTWAAADEPPRPLVLVLLMDGVAPAMIDVTPTPHLDRLRREGTFSRHLVPEFPTVSSVNHTTLTTGCRPARHGIVGNRFRDPHKGLFDQDQDADWLTGCRTLPEVAERQGLRAAALGFTCRRSSRRGPLASIVSSEPDTGRFPDDLARARDVARLAAVAGPEAVDLILAYFLGADEEAHHLGMFHDETRRAVQRVDRAVGLIRSALDEVRRRRPVRWLVVADHGMAPAERLVNIGRIMRHLDVAGLSASSGSTSYLYLEDPRQRERVAERLRTVPGLAVFEKNAFPAYAHLGSGPRVGDLLLSAEPGEYIEDPDRYPWYAHWLGVTRIWPLVFTPPFGGLAATHGYPPFVEAMHAPFYAWGDGVPAGVELGEVNMVDLHVIAAHWLGIRPGPHAVGRVPAGLRLDVPDDGPGDAGR